MFLKADRLKCADPWHNGIVLAGGAAMKPSFSGVDKVYLSLRRSGYLVESGKRTWTQHCVFLQAVDSSKETSLKIPGRDL
jgi:hypothetical protein